MGHGSKGLRSILLVSALGTTLLGSCSKDPAPTTVSAGSSEVLPTTASKKPTRVSRKPDDSAATLLRFLPRDSSAVVGINWSKARKNPIVTGFDDKIVKAIPFIAEAPQKCGLDPLTAVHSVAVGVGANPNDDDAMVIAISGAFTRPEFEACERAFGGKSGGNGSDEPHVHWPLPNVIVMSSGVPAETLALAPAASVWDNDKLMVLVDELDLHATLWVAGMLPASLASTFSSMGAAPWGGYLTLDLPDGMRANLGLEFSSADEAQTMLTMFENGLSMAKGQAPMDGLLNSVTLGVVEDAVVVVGEWTKAELEQIQMMLKQAGVL